MKTWYAQLCVYVLSSRYTWINIFGVIGANYFWLRLLYTRGGIQIWVFLKLDTFYNCICRSLTSKWTSLLSSTPIALINKWLAFCKKIDKMYSFKMVEIKNISMSPGVPGVLFSFHWCIHYIFPADSLAR